MRVISELAQASYPIRRDSAVHPVPAEDVAYRIAVRDLRLDWSIGVFDYEHRKVQPVCINLDLEAVPLDDWEADDYDAVPCYARIVERIQQMAEEGHVKLVETLANRIADLCLEDHRILSAKVRVEKPEALALAASVGVEVTRSR
ncbi:dihydroneopterin aldolase [Rhodospirillaceae bacterium KN72]|uniref:7,8-dihydroneopterin aldolase n=1 Tax=Pacificispira spongiicola TaxID=2729598 RepID=A0A7Y0DZU6_9PROT|nr:dihydroneopterin aldolase [Pacificispira spongiicola]NMM44644.1 dihydroneopterin aldolase [Pacificispira spongiicola]